MLDRVFKAFSYPDFRLMWIGACTSSIGTWMQILAQSWLVYNLSHSSVYLGLDVFCGQVPIFLFSLFGGVFADRRSRRTLLLISQYGQMTCAFILTALVYTNTVRVWHILCLSFAVGLVQSFGGPAYSALIPTLVPKEHLSNAIALNSIQFNLARVLGPMLGGIALSKLGATWCFALNGVSYIAVVITLYMISVKFVPMHADASVMESMREGIDFIRKREGMLSLVALAFLMMFLSYPLLTFLPVVARDVFHGGSDIFTLFLCLSGAGSVAGALIVAGIKSTTGLSRRALIVMTLLGIFITGFGLSRNLAVSSLLIFCSGAALMVFFTSNTSLVQMYVGDQMRGRVMSVYNVAFRGGMPFGSLISGLLIRETSEPAIMTANGVLVVVLGLYYLLIQRRLAKL
ncbi:MAG TPA: MFS transporter [Bryobacteraceae bacterium]|nr:MFS transporter [Bryobacteraceae bacterium]